jgi:hypothetical protein
MRRHRPGAREGGGGVILRGIVGLALLPVLVSLYVAGAVMGLLWIGVVAGWHSAGEVIDWIVGDTHTWKVTIQRVRVVSTPSTTTPLDPGHE